MSLGAPPGISTQDFWLWWRKAPPGARGQFTQSALRPGGARSVIDATVRTGFNQGAGGQSAVNRIVGRANQVRSKIDPRLWRRMGPQARVRLANAWSEYQRLARAGSWTKPPGPTRLSFRLSRVIRVPASGWKTPPPRQAQVRALEKTRQQMRNLRSGMRQILAQAEAKGAASRQIVVQEAERRIAAQQAAAQLRGWGPRAFANSARVALSHPVTWIALATIGLTAVYIVYRNSGATSALGSDFEAPAIVVGDPPEGTCVQGEAANRGLVWSGQDGEACNGRADCTWSAPLDHPEPNWADFVFNYYRVNRGTLTPELEADLAGAVAAGQAEYLVRLTAFMEPRMQAAQEACGIGAVWPIPTNEEICAFLPEGFVELPRSLAINETNTAFSSCVKKDPRDPEHPYLWAEVYAIDETDQTAEEWIELFTVMANGRRLGLEIGDTARHIIESRREIVAGSIGPVAYFLYACSECAEPMTGDLPEVATGIVDAYLAFAAAQG